MKTLGQMNAFVLLLICAVSAVLSVSVTISITQFEDDNLYLQFYPFTGAENEKALALKCVDRNFNVPVKEHLSEYRGFPLLRARLGKIGVKSEEQLKCLLFSKSQNQILEIPVRRLLGQPHSSAELPKEISWAPAEEIDINAESNPYYDFDDNPLVKIETIEKIYDEHDFGVLDIGLRNANLHWKAEQGVKIYLSLTSSPTRLKLLHYTLRSMDLSLVDEVLISLPKLFKGTQKYAIPRALLREFPKIKLLSEERDFGPICKLVTAVQFVQQRDPIEDFNKAIFITIDDDNLYTDRMIDTLAYHSFINGKSVIATASFEFFPFLSFGIHRPQETTVNGAYLKRVADLEGFAGVAYRGGLVDWKLMKFLADKSSNAEHRFCYFSDDVVISNVLLARNVQILRLPAERSEHFYSRDERRDLPHYQDSNSLQLTDEDGKRDQVYMHVRRYQYCQMNLLYYFIDFNQSSFSFRDLPKY